MMSLHVSKARPDRYLALTHTFGRHATTPTPHAARTSPLGDPPPALPLLLPLPRADPAAAALASAPTRGPHPGGEHMATAKQPSSCSMTAPAASSSMPTSWKGHGTHMDR